MFLRAVGSQETTGLPGKLEARPKQRVKRLRKAPALLREYMANSTFHGLKYTTNPDLHPLKRVIWIGLFVVCAGYSMHASYTVAKRFQDAPTHIQIESMTYVVSNLPFPSVTICPIDHVDWSKLIALQGSLIPDASNATRRTFQDLVGKLSAITFGDYDLLDFLRNRTLDDLFEINMTELLMATMPSCETFMSQCWWRNGERDCCEIFELQRTEYGLCYSFNSELSDARVNGTTRRRRPRRSASYGDWTGVRVTIHLGNITRPPISTEIQGIVLMINDPRIWPNNGNTIPAGTAQAVSVDCISGYATDDVLSLEDGKRPCRDEGLDLYTQETCVSRCKRRYAIDVCGCNPTVYFQPNSVRECRIKDIPCLMDYNDLFNDYQVTNKDERIKETGKSPSEMDRMLCDCPPECEYFAFNTRQVGAPIETKTDVMLDIHYAGPMVSRYKTDILYTKLELLVAFGGLMGLFLGGSILSIFELLYYLGLATFFYLRRICKTRKRKFPGRRFTPAPVLPVLDYCPARNKPQFPSGPRLATYERRIQDFAALKNRY